MYGRRSLSWVALVGIVLAGTVAVSAETAAAPRSKASPFALVFAASHEPQYFDCEVAPNFRCLELRHVGTFTSGAPFCESGTAEDPQDPNREDRRYTCADGSGSLTLSISGKREGLGTERGWTFHRTTP